MNANLFEAVDEYLDGLYVPGNDAIAAALAANHAAGLPAIDVTATQGKLLHLLARIRGAQRILEVGTLGGYSSLWLASALPAGGRLVTLEISPRHAAVARGNFERAGLADRIELIVGPALDSLSQLTARMREPFDLVFIDADKPNNPNYLSWALQLTRRGSLIIVDNVVREGQVANAGSRDENVLGTRKLHELLARQPRLSATAIQTVGSKGHDGFALALVTADP